MRMRRECIYCGGLYEKEHKRQNLCPLCRRSRFLEGIKNKRSSEKSIDDFCVRKIVGIGYFLQNKRKRHIIGQL
jgi:CRISPR/Cas system-associated protein Cas10 (large subunit of type III CRISPR-Cas system)